MKKRLICLLLALGLFLSLAACDASTPQDPGNFYYRKIETDYLGTDGIIAPELRNLAEIDNIGQLLELYFQGPQTPDLEAPFPRDTKVLDWSFENQVLHMTLNKTFAQLSGIELTVACGCISRTFLELTDASTVQISAADALLGAEESITMTSESLQLMDDAIDKLRTDLTLYYTDEDRRYLIGQTLSINLAAQDDIVGYLVEQLKTAPTGMGLVSPLPKNTKLLDSTIESGVCTLNFSSEFESKAFSDGIAQRTTLLSLVNTLTQLEDIDRVEFRLEGNLLVRYHQINISKALIFDESIVGPVRTGVNEFDATLYVSNGSALYLSGVPCRIRYTTGISREELVINTLLSYQNNNGFYSVIPESTKLLGVITEEGICTVNLSGEFLTAKNLPLAVHSICASICALEDIQSVQVRIDGKIPENHTPELFEAMQPEPDWFV